MPTIRSSGVFVQEYDFSQRAQQLGLARVLCVGGATKGPLNEPTLITSEAQLIRKFGPPVNNDYGLHAALRFLSKGNNLLYLRVADDDATVGAAAADVPVPGLAGGTAATAASGTITVVAQPADGEVVTIEDGTDPAVAPTATITFDGGNNPSDTETITIDDGIVGAAIVFEFDNNAAITGDVSVAIGGSAAATLAALKTAIEGTALAVTVTDTTGGGDPQLTLTHTTAGTTYNGEAVTEAGANITTTNFANGTASNSEVTFEFDDDGAVTAGNTSVLIGASTSATASSLAAAIAASSLAVTVTTNLQGASPILTLNNNATGTAGNQSIVTDANPDVTVTGMSGGAAAVAPTAKANVCTFRAKTPGSHGNSIQVTVQNTTQTGGTGKDILVYAVKDATVSQAVQLVERYVDVSLAAADTTKYIETIIEEGIDTGYPASNYIEVDVAHDGATMTNGTYTLGAGGGEVGRDGITGLADADYVGTVSGTTSTGLQAAANPEKHEFNFVMVPGVSTKTVIGAMIDLCEARGDAVALIDPPLGLSKAGVLDWHNGLDETTPEAPIAPIASSYAAVNWPWVYDHDAYLKTQLWLPPSGFVAGVMSYSYGAAAPHYAAAGHKRGRINGIKLEYSATQDDRAELSGQGNRVNPIIEYAVGDAPGFFMYGNRTCLRTESMLADLNIRNGLIYAEVLCAHATRVLVFDPNDPATWMEFATICNRILNAIKSDRGFKDLKVICDESTNPPDQVRDRRMEAKLLVSPVRAAETIVLNFGVFESGAEFDESLIP